MVRDIKLAPKLNSKVLSPTNTEKQCVRSAVSLFSPSVTAALETYMVVEPELFSDAGPTVEFLKKITSFGVGQMYRTCIKASMHRMYTSNHSV